MLTDWTYWLSCRHISQLAALLWALLLIDGGRYVFIKLAFCFWDCMTAAWRRLRGISGPPTYAHCPSVCVIIAAYNEEKNIEASLRSVWGTYPRLEIIVVDDGSDDRTPAEARRFASTHAGVQVLRMPNRSGKSPALNLALQYTKAEVIIGLDADSQLHSAAVWEIVQALSDPRVGAVSGAVLGRNAFDNLLTWFQAYEYLQCIFAERIVSARLGILGIASGAFSAFRREVLDMGFGWDEGSGADLDLTLRIRKSGYEIAHAPYAECYTGLLTTWRGLIKQRRRWDQSIAIRCHGRKHVDMAYPWSRSFRIRDCIVLIESWFFSLFCMYAIFAWAIWLLITAPGDWNFILLTLFFGYQGFECLRILSTLYYSNNLKRDALVCAVFPLMLIYQTVLLVVRLVATTEEILFRSSYAGSFTPERVRNATWHW